MAGKNARTTTLLFWKLDVIIDRCLSFDELRGKMEEKQNTQFWWEVVIEEEGLFLANGEKTKKSTDTTDGGDICGENSHFGFTDEEKRVRKLKRAWIATQEQLQKLKQEAEKAVWSEPQRFSSKRDTRMCNTKRLKEHLEKIRTDMQDRLRKIQRKTKALKLELRELEAECQEISRGRVEAQERENTDAPQVETDIADLTEETKSELRVEEPMEAETLNEVKVRKTGVKRKEPEHEAPGDEGQGHPRPAETPTRVRRLNPERRPVFEQIQERVGTFLQRNLLYRLEAQSSTPLEPVRIRDPLDDKMKWACPLPGCVAFKTHSKEAMEAHIGLKHTGHFFGPCERCRFTSYNRVSFQYHRCRGICDRRRNKLVLETRNAVKR